MNVSYSPGQDVFAPDVVERARQEAAARGVRLLEALEEQAGAPPAEFVAALAERFGAEALDMTALHALEPAFDVLTFAEALQRECLPMRDPAGELLAFARMDGAGISTIQNALGKAVTSARFRSPSQRFDSLATVRPGLLTFENVTAVEGGVPIVVEGVVVGAIGVSGASSAQDAQVGRAGAAAVRP